MSYLCASSTLEEAAETFSRQLPLQLSARQALNLMQPLGEALQQQEDEQVRALWEQALQWVLDVGGKDDDVFQRALARVRCPGNVAGCSRRLA